MRQLESIFFFCIFLSLPSLAQNTSFVQNQGQWHGDFKFKLPLETGGVFISPNSVVYHFGRYDLDAVSLETKNPQAHAGQIPEGTPFIGHAYEVIFQGANEKAQVKTSQKRKTYQNYLIGKDRSKWKSDVGLFAKISFENIYPEIDIRYYFNRDENLKYDLILKPGANPDLIKLKYQGADDLKLVYGNLMVRNSVEDVLESAPIAYQVIEGEKVAVKCKYVLKEDVLSYKLGSYNSDYELVIDPVLIFSTYSGSKVDNFGFTATYGIDGSAYGGGIAYNSNPSWSYPVTLGAYQDTFQGGAYDVAITKYTADGSEMIYSTYLGGDANEVPLSLIETKNKELLILGATGSSDFPTSILAYDSVFSGGTNVNLSGSVINYPNGSDVFIAKLDSTGGQLLGSTFFGGTGNDGVNSVFRFNYADENRADISLDTAGNIYIAASTTSKDLLGANYYHSAIGLQDGVLASFNPDLKNIRWTNYLSGSVNEAALSLKVAGDQVYVAGITSSRDLDSLFFEGFNEKFSGDHDGFVLRARTSDGTVNAFTYNGTKARDRNFLLDVDADKNVYVFGHTMGRYPILGNNVFFQPRGNQFINKFNPDLSQSLKSMIFGDFDSTKTEVSPTAFMVDDCKNIYLSGYGRRAGSGYPPQGPSIGLPITNNFDDVKGARAITDGEDFYFMVLDASWEKVNFGAYFGEFQATQGDHVDGGTSRFQRDGTIYQAVCASCGGTNNFPVSDSAFSTSNESSNCNMAVLKLRMELEVSVDFQPDLDSSCIPYTASISNKSYNADVYEATLPDGTIIQAAPNQVVIDQVGVYYLKVVARDTTCGFVDSVRIRFFGYTDPLDADFSFDYDTCDGGLTVDFKNQSTDATSYYWDFGDGNFSSVENPIHDFPQEGTYTVRMIVSGGDCGNSDTNTATITVRSKTLRGEFQSEYDPCINGTEARFFAGGGGFQLNNWSVDNQFVADSNALVFDFLKPGTYEVKLESVDTVCNRIFTHRETITIINFDENIELPNVFSPNGDQVNDVLHFTEIPDPEFFESFSLKIYNRWGSELFVANSGGKGWDGTFENKDVPQGVYYYVLTYSDLCGNNEESNGFFHLFR